jgi:hypothetical protein
VLGQLLIGRRESFVLGSKYTVSRNGSDPNAAGNARKNLRISLETSLRRLETRFPSDFIAQNSAGVFGAALVDPPPGLTPKRTRFEV